MEILDPKILFYGQWMLFLASCVVGIWGTGYALWVSVQLGTQWYTWLERKRDFQREKLRSDLSHHQAVKDLELKTLRAKHEMELEREKAHNASMTAAIREVEGASSSPLPVPIKSIG